MWYWIKDSLKGWLDGTFDVPLDDDDKVDFKDVRSRAKEIGDFMVQRIMADDLDPEPIFEAVDRLIVLYKEDLKSIVEKDVQGIALAEIDVNFLEGVCKILKDNFE